ncbi:MAG TPA: hypothetical protein VFV38_34830 [Ktedonobacteraceae bacterium]|nr:hypothetical protein [Ktedonobacteraceae bacterium]
MVSLVSDQVYGPPLLALARRRLTQANGGDSVAGAIEIDGLVTAGHGVFLAEGGRALLRWRLSLRRLESAFLCSSGTASDLSEQPCPWSER